MIVLSTGQGVNGFTLDPVSKGLLINITLKAMPYNTGTLNKCLFYREVSFRV